MGFRNLGFSELCDMTSLVLRSVKKNKSKITKTQYFSEK